jgi:IS5 family transposase
MQMLRAEALATELRHFAGLAQRVISQAERRVLRGESVPAGEKLFSIFETHTNIIAKDNREPVFGHKVCLTAGASCLVTDIVVVEGNPADVTLAVNRMERQREIFGTAPRQASFDGGFASRANLDAIEELGVKDVAFHEPCGLAITKMVGSSWVYRQLRRFRAGVEAIISLLERSFGLARCSWRGFASFRAYVAGSVLACNLLVVARHLLAAKE